MSVWSPRCRNEADAARETRILVHCGRRRTMIPAPSRRAGIPIPKVAAPWTNRSADSLAHPPSHNTPTPPSPAPCENEPLEISFNPRGAGAAKIPIPNTPVPAPPTLDGGAFTVTSVPKSITTRICFSRANAGLPLYVLWPPASISNTTSFKSSSVYRSSAVPETSTAPTRVRKRMRDGPSQPELRIGSASSIALVTSADASNSALSLNFFIAPVRCSVRRADMYSLTAPVFASGLSFIARKSCRAAGDSESIDLSSRLLRGFQAWISGGNACCSAGATSKTSPAFARVRWKFNGRAVLEQNAARQLQRARERVDALRVDPANRRRQWGWRAAKNTWRC